MEIYIKIKRNKYSNLIVAKLLLGKFKLTLILNNNNLPIKKKRQII